MSQNDEQNSSNINKGPNENTSTNDSSNLGETSNLDASRIDFTTDGISQSESTNNASSNPESSTIIEEIETKRKKSKKVKLGIFAAVACLLIIIGAFSVPAIRSVFSFSTKNPNEYLKSVLSEETNKLSTYLKSNTEKQLKARADGTSFDMNLKLTLGDYAKQFLANDTIDLDNLNAFMKINTKGNEVSTTAKFSLNGIDLFSYLMSMSLDQQVMYMQIPELSSAYLKTNLVQMSQDVYSYDYLNKVTAFQNTLTPDTIEKLSKNYINVILDTLDDVSLEKDVKVNVNVLDATYNKLSVSLSEQDMIDIQIAILKQALNDKESLNIIDQLFQLAEQSAPTKEDIQTNIDELEASRETASQEEVVNFSIYVDNKSLKGIEINATDDNATKISFITAKKADSNSLIFKVSNNDTEYVSVLGKWDSTSTGETGTIDIKAITDDYSETTTSINISFQDIKVVNKEIGTVNGTLLISSDSFAGISLACSLQGSDKTQNITLAVNTMGMELGTLSIDYTQTEFNEIIYPAADAEVYDMETDMETYISNSNLFGFLYDLSEKLNIDLTSLLMGSEDIW